MAAGGASAPPINAQGAAVKALVRSQAGLFIAGAGFAAAGLARSTAEFAIALGTIGVGCSAYHPSGLALLSKGMRGRGWAL